MRVLVIYDSVYGNTEKIAQVIGNTLHAKVLHIDEVGSQELDAANLLVVGSPVHGGRPTPAMDHFLKNLPVDALKGTNVATFDTRFSPEQHGLGLRLLMSIIRYAAERMAKILAKKGGRIISRPVGFIVKDKRGPLADGEVKRAIQWAEKIRAAFI